MIKWQRQKVVIAVTSKWWWNDQANSDSISLGNGGSESSPCKRQKINKFNKFQKNHTYS